MNTVYRRMFVICLVGCVFVLGVLVGRGDLGRSSVTGALVRSNLTDYTNKDLNFGLYWQVWEKLQQEYVGSPVPDSQLFYGSLSGMVKALKDDYSNFFTPEAAKEFDREFEGEFEGIGAEIGIKNEHLVIISPLPNTPAERAGLRPGDQILKINGTSADEYTLDEAVLHIRGRKGTVVKLEIIQNDSEPKEFSVTRDTIVVKEVSVLYKTTPRGAHVAQVKLSSFNNNAFTELQSAAREISVKGVSGIIFDLRNNPGGLIDQSVSVASLWVPEGKAIVTESGKGLTPREDSQRKTLVSDGNGLFAQYPTVVLINKGSASASEIVAGALQDYHLATLIGETTFGKGSVQSYSKFQDGSAIKVTVAKWYTPLDRGIDKAGIKPDLEVKLSEEDFAADRDPQLERGLEELDRKIRK